MHKGLRRLLGEIVTVSACVSWGRRLLHQELTEAEGSPGRTRNMLKAQVGRCMPRGLSIWGI